MEVISEEAWAWMLFHDSSFYYLSIACGSVGIFTRDIELTKNEIIKFENEGISYIKSLASQVTENPSLFEKRHLNSFNNMQGVKEAALKWRAEKSYNKALQPVTASPPLDSL
jgi:hypothetical protein